MAVLAQWLNKTWEINPQKIMALENLSTSFELRADTKDDAEGKPSVNVRGLELQPLSFETFLSDSVGIDVRAEIESWSKLVGESGAFMLAGRRFEPEKIQLIKINTANTIVDDFGRIRQAKLTMNFREDAGEPGGSKPQNKKSTKKSKLTPGIAGEATYSELGFNSSAANVGASTVDKRSKKPLNTQMASM